MQYCDIKTDIMSGLGLNECDTVMSGADNLCMPL